MTGTKRIVLIRHAKSSWANPLQSDYERPLNERGKSDAPMMGERLKEAGIVPDKIVASSAKRAAQTAKLVATALDFDKANIEWHEELYHCVPSVFEELIHDMDDQISTLFIVAHNPGISEYAARLSGSHEQAHMPTCALVGVEADIESWLEFGLADKRMFLHDTPKKNDE